MQNNVPQGKGRALCKKLVSLLVGKGVKSKCIERRATVKCDISGKKCAEFKSGPLCVLPHMNGAEDGTNKNK